MIRVKRQIVVDRLKEVDMTNKGGYKKLVRDAMYGNGEEAIAFLVRKGFIRLPYQVLKKEVDDMVEESLISIEQWEQFHNLMLHAQNGLQRVTIFLKRKSRITMSD